MLDADAVLSFALQRIGQIYERPLMYGGTAQCVETVLHYFHELASKILERDSDLREFVDMAHAEAGGVARYIATSHRGSHENATEKEFVDSVVMNWQRIDAQLGLKIPYTGFMKSNDT